MIEQCEPSYPGARQRFGAVGADPAHAGDEDMLTFQICQTIVADEDVGTGELGRDSVLHMHIIKDLVIPAQAGIQRFYSKCL